MTKMAEMDQKPIFLETSDLVRLADHPDVRLYSPDTQTHVMNLPSYKATKWITKNKGFPLNPIIPLAHRFGDQILVTRVEELLHSSYRERSHTSETDPRSPLNVLDISGQIGRWTPELYDMYGLYDLAPIALWGPFNLHDIQ